MCLFDQLMIELTTCLNEEKRFRKVKPNKKEGEKRYKIDMVGISDDCKAIAIYQPTVDGFNFAKRVADFYGCVYKTLSHTRCPEGGEFELRIYF